VRRKLCRGRGEVMKQRSKEVTMRRGKRQERKR
jgi:hypothetical protein